MAFLKVFGFLYYQADGQTFFKMVLVLMVLVHLVLACLVGAEGVEYPF